MVRNIGYKAVAVLAAGFTFGVVPPATAAEVAPGAPMRIMPNTFDDHSVEMPLDIATQISCSQGVPGTVTLPDGSQKNVMVSAAHCFQGVEGEEYETAPEIYVPLPEGRKLVMVRDKGEKFFSAEEAALEEDGNPDWTFRENLLDPEDWATAEVLDDVEMTRVVDSVDQYGRKHGDPVVLTGVRDYRDLGEWEVSFDNFGQPICKDGGTSGRTCGVQLMRTSNGIWFGGVVLSGDSGGVNFDPNNGEALGVSSLGFYGLLGRAQPVDVALEKAYGIPDGQVNEYFSMPDSTQPHTPMLTVEEDFARQEKWAEENLPSSEPEPVTLSDATDTALSNFEAGVGEVTLQTQDSVRLLSKDPTQIETAVNNAVDTAQYIGGLVEETAQTYGEALDTHWAEEQPEFS